MDLTLAVILAKLQELALQTIFISMLAIAAAIVLALKELIMNVTGGFPIKINKHFKLSDRIEVDGITYEDTDLIFTEGSKTSNVFIDTDITSFKIGKSDLLCVSISTKFRTIAKS